MSRSRRSRGLAVVLLAPLIVASADAHAGGFVRVPSFTTPPACNSLTLCGSDVECTAGDTCASYGGAGSYCTAAGLDLYCCESSATCPAVDGAATTCTQVATSMGAIAICLPPVSRFCTDDGNTPTWDAIERCYRSATTRTAHVHDWEQGDCDGDGIANGIDATPCELVTDAGTISPDATVSPDVVSVDVTLFDSAFDDVIPGDAAARDATASDGSRADGASAHDGSASRDDGATSPIPAVSFRGGGARCSARPESRSQDGRNFAWTAAAAALAALVRMRRSRSATGRHRTLPTIVG